MPDISDMPGNPEEPGQEDANDGLFAGNLPIQEALLRLRLRLLDLTGRNRLLNFKHSPGKSLQFVNCSVDSIFSRLVDAGPGAKIEIKPVPEPAKEDWSVKNGRLSKPDAKDHAVACGIDVSIDLPEVIRRSSRGDTQVQALYFAEDLGKHCRKLDREARLAIEETGANMLYLVLGFLEYVDVKDSDRFFQAPLVCIPVKLEKVDAGKFPSFNIVFTGDELTDNLSLREKVKRDFGLNLPEFVEGETSLNVYFSALQLAIEDQPGWKLRRRTTLALLSFTNMLLVRDLDPEKWPRAGAGSSLTEHPIIRRVFEGNRTPSEDDARYSQEYKIDEHRHVDLPLIYDADSSQHSALIDVLDGKTIVIEGPPGTGKSQTIASCDSVL